MHSLMGHEPAPSPCLAHHRLPLLRRSRLLGTCSCAFAQRLSILSKPLFLHLFPPSSLLQYPADPAGVSLSGVLGMDSAREAQVLGNITAFAEELCREQAPALVATCEVREAQAVRDRMQESHLGCYILRGGRGALLNMKAEQNRRETFFAARFLQTACTLSSPLPCVCCQLPFYVPNLSCCYRLRLSLPPPSCANLNQSPFMCQTGFLSSYVPILAVLLM